MKTNLYKRWITVTLGCLVVAGAMSRLTILHPNTLFTYGCAAWFAVLTLCMLLLGKEALSGSNNYTFINVVMGYLMGKMFLSIIAIFLYVYIQRPHTYYFLIPAVLFYIIYTIFEVRTMVSLQKTK